MDRLPNVRSDNGPAIASCGNQRIVPLQQHASGYVVQRKPQGRLIGSYTVSCREHGDCRIAWTDNIDEWFAQDEVTRWCHVASEQYGDGQVQGRLAALRKVRPPRCALRSGTSARLARRVVGNQLWKRL